jgi:hypothetical protein
MDLLLEGTLGKIDTEIIIHLYSIFDDHLSKQGNKAYESISWWE